MTFTTAYIYGKGFQQTSNPKYYVSVWGDMLCYFNSQKNPIDLDMMIS